MVASPTGTGYVNYAAVTALELLSRGDCATVAMQYSARPSVLSLDHVNEGRAQARHAARRAPRSASRRSRRPQRPKFVLFGESLGAWTSQDPVRRPGHAGPRRHRHRPRDLDRHAALQQVEGAGALRRPARRRPVASCGCSTTSASGTRSTRRERAQVRYVMITHHDDGVALFGPELAIQAPEWLGPAGRAADRGAEGHALDAEHRVLPGARRHEELGQRSCPASSRRRVTTTAPTCCRSSTPRSGSTRPSEQLDAHQRTGSSARSCAAARWIKAHGGTGKSLAVAVVERPARGAARRRGSIPNAQARADRAGARAGEPRRRRWSDDPAHGRRSPPR